ncbi:MAG: hypothetical protein ACXIVQ_14540 [Acidimicrobiales bacterium]
MSSHRRRPLAAPVAVAMVLLVVAMGLAVSGASQVTAQVDDTDTTVAPEESETQLPTGNILPRPNTGRAPDSPNDPGGWQQYMVFGLIFAGLGVIVALVVRDSRKAKGSATRS